MIRTGYVVRCVDACCAARRDGAFLDEHGLRTYDAQVLRDRGAAERAIDLASFGVWAIEPSVIIRR